MYGAGSETVTATGIMSMILAAACHPEAQTRVWEELDAVVGKDRGQYFGYMFIRATSWLITAQHLRGKMLNCFLTCKRSFWKRRGGGQ
ncbi:hypothetical protein ID866_7914 [Astraeus odoratus]|nr:hypothetical protein ID866_7914 [Astraeus odoratus]